MTTRTKTFQWEDPLLVAQAAREMDGLTFLTKLMQGELPRPPISALISSDLVEVEAGRVVFTAEAGEEHYNPIGMVHGGFAATILDSALGCAVQSTLPQGVGYTTVELHINLVRAIAANTGKLICEGKIIHSGRRLATAEATLKDSSGKLYAHATTTCMIFSGE